MRIVLVFLLFIASPGVLAGTPPEAVAVTAWFTDAAIEDSTQAPKPADALPEARGSFGKGVRLTKPIPVENPLLSQARGYIGFWIKPNWGGDDGKTHRILRIGDPERNGLLVEKSDLGMLRFVMASPKKISAARADVSHWKAGEWHHVVIVWMDYDGKPLGMPLYIDKTAVDGPVTADNAFLDPGAMADRRVWVGGESSEAVMDELIMRSTFKTELSGDQLAIVYRDYFRTAPYSAIRIDPEPSRVPADRRVISGFQKQFGLEGKLGAGMEDMTDFVAGFGQWSGFDAKPLITWRTSNEEIATVDENGLVTGNSVGRCTLIAEFRGMTDTYDLQVIPVEQPDLDLAFVERLPRYASDRLKQNPAPGEQVTSVAHIFNMGYKPVPAGTTVAFELFPDTNRNFRVDPAEEQQAAVQTQTIGALAPGEEVTVTFSWTWPEEPVWVRVTVDPGNSVEELCEANNRRWALNTARALRWGYQPDELKKFHDGKTINHVGSFSVFDWADAMVSRLELLLREAVYPSTSPDGVRDSVRLDMIAWEDDVVAPKKEEDHWKFWEGQWPHGGIAHWMAIDSGVMHECGHTCLALPDLYAYRMLVNRIYLKDENGDYYEGGELIPYLTWWKDLPRAPVSGVFPCGVGYCSLMDYCHMWLDESNAGKIQHYAGFRGERFWGSQGRLVPTWQNSLLVTDVYDRPLAGAAVYVYHVTNNHYLQSSGAKYYHDRAKFIGNTDQDGRFIFPKKTDKDWDDPGTDEVEHELAVWNPFGRAAAAEGAGGDVAFTPNVWCAEGLLLIKVVSGEQTEFHGLDLARFNIAYFRDKVSGVYPIRTSLQPCEGVTELVRHEIPEAIRETNLKPVAVVEPMELTVEAGEEFTLDGSNSHDPEEQPLIFYEWQARGGNPAPAVATGPIYKGTAPKEPGEFSMLFYVNDGLRVSKAVTVKVKVVEPEPL